MIKPDDLKDKALHSPSGMAETAAASTTPMPTLEQIGALMIGVRDDVAIIMGEVPEDVELIAVKVLYKVKHETIGNNKNYFAIATRQLVDPKYESVVADLL
jgi:hypothetical protein